MRATASDSQPPLLLPFFPESASRNPSSDPTSSPSSFPPSPPILSRKRVHNNHRQTVAVPAPWRHRGGWIVQDIHKKRRRKLKRMAQKKET
ncbi:hypothetical protein CDAR_27891 [Caerostris darwini]|uniref:Mitochondrial mRNA-processing protein COX24 C-terminal domain-containing protein n=1 Tax=Caerostris darwini TaxID=1538125 RepID=A0AAV4MW69_9ARAC|nr:hypothetical protein CDAR_27891 [Caerostris darwini]